MSLLHIWQYLTITDPRFTMNDLSILTPEDGVKEAAFILFGAFNL
jgi:hypothetical protein